MPAPESKSTRPALSVISRYISFRHAFAGIEYALRTQPNTWIHTLIMAAVIVVGWWLKLNPVEWALITLAIGLVWVAELFNTAVEAVVDLASPDIHPLAKNSKDVAAGAVLLAALTAVIIGLLVLGPPLWSQLSGL